jgi:class 3 adenylate cyclase
MTRISYYVARMQADVIRRRDELLKAFELSRDTTDYWAFMDLVGSSNYRLTRGAKEGYVRGEEFYSLVYSAIDPYGEVEAFKELGDGVLLRCSNMRPLFEASILIVQTAKELAHVAGSETFPFAVRISIGYGPCKRLRERSAADYIGSPIDEAARLNGAAEPDGIVVSEGAFEPNKQVMDEFADFVDFSKVKQLSPEQSKHMIKPVRFRQVTIHREAFNTYEGGFAPWRIFAEPGSTSMGRKGLEPSTDGL